MHKSVFSLWLSNCPAVVCADARAYECICVCALACRCPGVDLLPVTRSFGEQSGGEDSQGIGRAVRCDPRGVKVCVIMCSMCLLLGSKRCWCCVVSIVWISKFNMHMVFVTHTVCVYVFQTWSRMMSYAAAARLTDSFRTTTWGPMVRLSGW